MSAPFRRLELRAGRRGADRRQRAGGVAWPALPPGVEVVPAPGRSLLLPRAQRRRRSRPRRVDPLHGRGLPAAAGAPRRLPVRAATDGGRAACGRGRGRCRRRQDRQPLARCPPSSGRGAPARPRHPAAGGDGDPDGQPHGLDGARGLRRGALGRRLRALPAGRGGRAGPRVPSRRDRRPRPLGRPAPGALEGAPLRRGFGLAEPPAIPAVPRRQAPVRAAGRAVAGWTWWTLTGRFERGAFKAIDGAWAAAFAWGWHRGSNAP